ncbi:hypothetical protein DOTSEDRAFT_62213 [Dothistroma septosporum NZE10]|uniref:Uncharacterized protein n=1 Tax=Dothistroma septosporum (strain NZE10 / CBS 128990) TaxID=675120 RepID=N1PQL9_DOTSN|nr:hypothetical protein DOTSEDRAFT_62213 [Dothistroma septosporum NZE10]
MRLLIVSSVNATGDTLQLEYFVGKNIPPYAILSHTWGEGEVVFEDVKAGAARQAIEDVYKHIWIDTCCINKDSSAELQEAINSMYAWYQRSGICYAYLEDSVPLSASRWFTRGWTLRELLAPKAIHFYAKDWRKLGQLVNSPSDGLPNVNSYTTDIRSEYATNVREEAAQMVTTREESIAYCLLGIFGVNLPLLYGEESNAFLRLQEEIMKQADDQTLFVWAAPSSWALGNEYTGLLGSHPAFFALSGDVAFGRARFDSLPHSMTSRALEIDLLLHGAQDVR